LVAVVLVAFREFRLEQTGLIQYLAQSHQLAVQEVEQMLVKLEVLEVVATR
jgi:hypothetical protein